MTGDTATSVDAPESFSYSVTQTDSVPESLVLDVKRVFGENYREANFAYLEKGLGKLRYLSTARNAEGVLAGFALAETRVIDLPRAPASNVHLAGLCCVGVAFRRHGLFRKLESAALGANRLPPAERYLSCGRTAHPASFRGFYSNPAAVPRPGQVPTAWQQEVGIAIAEAYGSPAFDPVTFVVAGSGVPIGWPVIEIEATPEEWEMFKPVDRTKGDSLLGIAWNPGPPAGWTD